MGATVSREGSVRILAVDGELSGPHVLEFRDRVREELAADARDFIIDLTETSGVDSAGLEALTWLKRECEERLGLLKLCNVSETVEKVLHLTRLDRELERCDVLDEALASFG